MRELTRIAIVNRGEAAMRLIHAVRELAAEQRRDIRTIALHTKAESAAMFVREADEAVCLDVDGPSAVSPYLDLGLLEQALLTSRADAAWVGWGFVAERPEFAELCERTGITFVGPSAEVMRKLGDKIGAKLLAEAAGVPVAAWSGGPVHDVESAAAHAAAIGLPLMIKATSGGGGRGIRKVTELSELEAAFHSAQAEGLKAFADPTVFLERVVTDARHVEVQIIGDDFGTVWAVGVRDCTMQRRHQKVIEESSSTSLSAEQDAELRAAAVRLAVAAGYRNAGTVEFLYQPNERLFAFLEVNTRLQVEHPITELTTGLDLVKLQLHVAAGGALVGDPPPTFGHAIEARLNAEDPQRGFTPAPGRISMFSVPVGPGIRVDTGVGEGDVIPPEFDSMIAKIMAWGADRDEAMARLTRALSQTTVLVEGGTTNKAFLLALLERPEMRSGEFDTGWLDRLTATDEFLPTRLADVALIAAAVDAYDAQAAEELTTFFEWAERGRPQARGEVGAPVELRHQGLAYRVVVGRCGPNSYRVELDGTVAMVVVDRLGRHRSRITVGGRSFRVTSSSQRSDHLIEVDGVAHRFSRDDGGVVAAPAAALVVAVKVAVGDLVEVGDALVVVEAMKMEIAISATTAGRVREVLVARNVQVDAGSPLLRIEAIAPEADDETPVTGSRISLSELAEQNTEDSDRVGLMHALVLGFDIAGPAARGVLASYRRSDAASDSTDRTLDDSQLRVLSAFADVAAVTRDRRRDMGDFDELTSPRERFHAYLRSIEADPEALPQRFRERLLQALTNYGVADLEPTDQLREALYRIFVAQQRRADQLPVVMALLDRQLTGSTVDADASPALRDVLDRLIDATHRPHPAVANLARSVRYQVFERPIVDAVRAHLNDEMDTNLARLIDPDASESDRHDAGAELVACAQPVLPIVASFGALADDAAAGPLLEVLTRRYYKIRDLDGWSTEGSGDALIGRTSYVHRERRVHVLVARAGLASATDALIRLAHAATTVPSGETAVVDLFVDADDEDENDDDATPDQLAVHLQLLVDDVGFDQLVSRVAVIVCRRQPIAVDTFTYRRAEAGGERPYWMADDQPDGSFAEDVKFRGLHPMVARRLQMWRLANFEISRLPAVTDVHLFECVARANDADVRLVAVAEVRDLTPVLDQEGRMTALPDVEHLLAACLDAIRHAHSTSLGRGKLEWNRVMLYVWPTFDLPIDQLDAVVRRLAPLTEGLGIEQIVVQARIADPATGDTNEVVLRLGYEAGSGLTLQFTDPPTEPMQPLDDYDKKVLQARRRGMVYPYELVPRLCGPRGSFVEYDLDDTGALVAVQRDPGGNSAGVIIGVTSTPTAQYPDGMQRISILGDPTKAMGSIAEPECRRLLAAIDLAESMHAPIEWFALSAGAKIAMDSGSENLDWVARVLRRLVEHTQRGHEVNIVVAGINVGAQPYWNAESTMLMHTRGILVMTPESAMVLTGKQAIDYSGGVSAENNLGIGGYERVMGPNGEAQYWAPDLSAACAILHAHYAVTYVAASERWPRRAATEDPFNRDVRTDPHIADGTEFSTVGDVFSATKNPDRKKPFDIRTVMRATIDRDHEPLERWPEMAEAETAVVIDARLGGLAITMIGIESRPLPRHGALPADGPGSWSAGTLFPLSSKKVARAINAASGNRPVVVLANLSGFDGSPESLRRLQLEYGAEIGRAIVNFDGPIVLCVVSRYHGGAFVVFSGTLNDSMQVLAVEGSFASVIGGAPAAAVVFVGEVNARTQADARIAELDGRIAGSTDDDDRARLRAELAALTETVRVEKLGEVATEFDNIHSVRRAQDVGSVHRIIPAADLRPALIVAVERGMSAIDADPPSPVLPDRVG
ncbi:MAG: carboxyl transferase domain-containing protein [Ilumatobacteraceae bacterium]